MSIVLSSTGGNKARIMYENLLVNGTVTASDEDTNNPVENLFDYRTDDFFKQGSAGITNVDLTLTGSDSANYFAFYNSDLADNSGTIKLQYWNGSTYVDATSTITVTSAAPYVEFFDSKTSDKWRIVITSSAPSSVGLASFGEYLGIERGLYIGFTEPLLARETELLDNTTDGGNYIGQSLISKGVATNLNIEFASDDWVRQSWLPFVKHAETKPFWVSWDATNYATEVAYCKASNIGKPVHTHYGFMAVNLGVRGLVE